MPLDSQAAPHFTLFINGCVVFPFHGGLVFGVLELTQMTVFPFPSAPAMCLWSPFPFRSCNELRISVH